MLKTVKGLMQEDGLLENDAKKIVYIQQLYSKGTIAIVIVKSSIQKTSSGKNKTPEKRNWESRVKGYRNTSWNKRQNKTSGE